MAYAKLYRNRLDLSEWVIHFVHQRTGVEDLSDLAEIAGLEGYDVEDDRYPDYFSNGEPKNVLDLYTEQEIKLEDGASGFAVLKKILHDGYIHSGWSFRNNKPTIYGPRSAVCFTEMPLYALIQYAKDRGSISDYVGDYGIAFRRNELFTAGARPVIYGTTDIASEVEVDKNGHYCGRMLSEEESGLLLKEQYRYVTTNLPKDPSQKSIDWMMEREWRWALPEDRLGVPGLPFFLSKEYADYFTEVYIIVSTDAEMKEITDYLRMLYDSGSTNCGLEYNVSMIESAKVISLESIAKLDNSKFIKIDTIPYNQLHLSPKYNLSKNDYEQARAIYDEAQAHGDKAIEVYLSLHPNFDEQKGEWGSVHVFTYDFSPFIQALRELKLASSFSDEIYHLGQMSNCRSVNLNLLDVGAKAACKYLKEQTGNEFYIKWYFG